MLTWHNVVRDIYSTIKSFTIWRITLNLVSVNFCVRFVCKPNISLLCRCECCFECGLVYTNCEFSQISCIFLQGNFCACMVGNYKLIWDNSYSTFFKKVCGPVLLISLNVFGQPTRVNIMHCMAEFSVEVARNILDHYNLHWQLTHFYLYKTLNLFLHPFKEINKWMKLFLNLGRMASFNLLSWFCFASTYRVLSFFYCLLVLSFQKVVSIWAGGIWCISFFNCGI